MRRGNITSKSIVFIILVAIFTLLSYLFDQLVINFEDKLRNTKILYENKKNEFVKHETLSDAFKAISTNIDMTTSPFLIKRNFFIKSLILFDKDQKQKDFFDSYTGQNFDIEEWLQLQMQREFIDLAFFIAKIRKQYIYLYSYQEDIIKSIKNKNEYFGLELFDFIENPIDKKDEQDIFQHDIELYINMFHSGSFMEKFDLSNWMDVYRYKMLLLKKLDRDNTILEEFFMIIDDDKLIEMDEEIQEIFLLVRKISVRKNYFILFSILSQVLSLLFLLFLFRSFVLKK